MEILHLLVSFFQDYGYIAVFLVLLACGFGLPVPEDITLVSGGIISALGRTDVHMMFAVSMVGVLLGDGAVYAIGRVLGKDILSHPWVSRVLPLERYHRVQELYAKYGRLLVFMARFMPGFRMPVYLVAGISRKVPMPVFFLVDGFAAMISVPVWVYTGYFGADNFDRILEFVRSSQIGIFSVVGVIALYIAVKFLRNRKNSGSTSSTSERTP